MNFQTERQIRENKTLRDSFMELARQVFDLDFYPKFGFVQAEEYQHVMPVKPLKGDFAKLSVESEEGRETLRRLYRLSNPYSAFSMEDCWGILMFYCGNYLKDQVWYSKEYDMICVAEEKGEKLYCHDLFGQKRAPLQEILGSLAAEGVKEAWLGFTPEETGGCSAKKLKEDDITLFIWNRKENLFQKDFLRFPYLSMA